MTTPAATWAQTPWLGFDLETTGVSVEDDRIVTTALAWIKPGEKPQTWGRLVNPGVPIPDAAAEIHGITTERAQAEGLDPREVIDQIAQHLADAISAGWAIVGMNCPFDLTMEDRECRRYGLPTVEDRANAPIAPVIDVWVLDKYIEPYRKGKRNLTALCERYSVSIANAHDATADTLAAARVAWRIAQLAMRPAGWLTGVFGLKAQDAARLGALAGLSLAELHVLQVKAKADQAASFAAYLKRQGKPADDVRGEWPLIPFESARQEVLAP